MIRRAFMPQFAPLVEAGTKRQTIRPRPKRMPKVGEEFVAYEWTGKPYRSKTRELARGPITEVFAASVYEAFMAFPEVLPSELLPVGSHHIARDEQFAVKDGFKNFTEMRDWFRPKYGLPFRGICIRWK